MSLIRKFKGIIRITLTIILIFPPATFAAQQNSHMTYKLYRMTEGKQSTLKGFLDANKSEFTQKQYEFLSQKAQDKFSEKIKITFRNNQMLVVTNEQIVPFEIIDIEKRKFKVNGREVEIKDSESNEEIWQKIQAVLPTDKTSFIDYLLPKANAQPSIPSLAAKVPTAQGKAVAVVIVGLVILGGKLYMSITGQDCVQLLNDYVDKCEAMKSVVQARLAEYQRDRRNGNLETDADGNYPPIYSEDDRVSDLKKYFNKKNKVISKKCDETTLSEEKQTKLNQCTGTEQALLKELKNHAPESYLTIWNAISGQNLSTRSQESRPGGGARN